MHGQHVPLPSAQEVQALQDLCAGGLGLAAIQVATAAGARVLATAGSVQKRSYLRRQGVDTVVSSRSLDFGAHLGCREGTQPTIVLNCLTSPGWWHLIIPNAE